MCEHDWQYSHYDEGENKEYVVCAKCGLTREMCEYCEGFNKTLCSDYNVFTFDFYKINGKTVLNVNSEHNDCDELEINYCPMCGRKLKG